MPHDERSRLRANEMVVENSPSDPRHDHCRAEPHHREVETPDRAHDRKRDRLRTLACLASAASYKNRGLDHGRGRWERLRKPSIRRRGCFECLGDYDVIDLRGRTLDERLEETSLPPGANPPTLVFSRLNPRPGAVDFYKLWRSRIELPASQSRSRS